MEGATLLVWGVEKKIDCSQSMRRIPLRKLDKFHHVERENLTAECDSLCFNLGAHHIKRERELKLNE
jgi:hypothetical protein